MKIKIVLLTALILALGLTGFAQSKTTSAVRDTVQPRAHLSTQTQTVQQFVNDVAKAWSQGNLAGLDARRPYVGTVRVIVEAQVGSLLMSSARPSGCSHRLTGGLRAVRGQTAPAGMSGR
jgi:hypothetical protein